MSVPETTNQKAYSGPGLLGVRPVRKRSDYSGPLFYRDHTLPDQAFTIADYTGPLDIAVDNPGNLWAALPGEVFVVQSLTGDLSGTVKVIQIVPNTDLVGECNVAFVVNLSGECEVLTAFYTDLAGEVSIIFSGETHFSSDIPGECVLTKLGLFSGLLATCTVQQRFTADLHGQCNFLMTFLAGKVTIQARMTQDQRGKVTIIVDAPGPVTNIRGNVPLGVYQPDPNVLISWDAAVPLLSSVVAYRWTVDMNPTSSFDESWFTTTDLEAAFDLLNDYSGVGSYWFHVAATSAAGFTGPVSHALVMYNTPPTVPGIPLMTVNGNDTLTHTPLLTCDPAARPLFSWSPGNDPDGFGVTYEIQIATRADFDYEPLTGHSSVLYNPSNIPTNSWQIGQNLKPGIWFWRIRTSDGKQSSGWSAVGGFRVNAPPKAPTNLLVISN